MSRQHWSGERLYVGNLPYDVTEREVDDLFYKVSCLYLFFLARVERPNDLDFAAVSADFFPLVSYIMRNHCAVWANSRNRGKKKPEARYVFRFRRF